MEQRDFCRFYFKWPGGFDHFQGQYSIISAAFSTECSVGRNRARAQGKGLPIKYFQPFIKPYQALSKLQSFSQSKRVSSLQCTSTRYRNYCSIIYYNIVALYTTIYIVLVIDNHNRGSLPIPHSQYPHAPLSAHL